MGISLSCIHYCSLHERLLGLISDLVNFGRGKTNVTVQTPILRALGSGKMLIERSLSMKRADAGRKDGLVRKTSLNISTFNSQEMVVETSTSEADCPKHEAATKLQKVYKSFRTRRQLADCAVLVEQRWWKVLDSALLERNSVSFFDDDRTETVVSRWSRARMRAAKVGKGMLKDVKARKLALQHWLEAIDPRHRYGHNLHFYYLKWLECESKQPFFYWLDVGKGKEENLQRCSRAKLQQQCIKYLSPKEREAYEVVVEGGKLIYKQSRQLLDTSVVSGDLKWIFVLSTSKQLYVGQKKKGRFQHSSFLAGGATSSAGRLVVENGVLKAVWAHSGHYRPTEENFLGFIRFLHENSVDLREVKKSPVEEDEDCWGRSASSSNLARMSSHQRSSKHLNVVNIDNFDDDNSLEVLPPFSHEGLGNNADLKMGDSCLTFDETMQCGVDEVIFKKCEEGESDEDTDDNADVIGTPEAGNLPSTTEDRCHSGEDASISTHHCTFHKKNLFEEDPEQPIPKELILKRIDSIERTKSLQLAMRWSSGVGPRIGCVRDYPSQVQCHALERVNLSPRGFGHHSLSSTCFTPKTRVCPTPRTSVN